MGFNTNIDELEEGEYFVVGHLSIDIDPFIFNTEDDPLFISFNLKDLEVKTKVNDYSEASYHLLGVAERLRNYAAFFTKRRLPLSCNMSGKRKDMGFPLFPMVAYDGATNLPMSDGGFNDVSLFITGFGPNSGLKPPFEALQSMEHLKNWSGEIHKQLIVAQKALDMIKAGSRLDMAVSSLGKCIWMEGAEDRLHNCWLSLESIAKSDFPDTRVYVSHVFKSIKKRLKTSLSSKQLKFYQDFRHKSVHEIPVPEDSYRVHMTAGILYRLASKTLEAELLKREIIEKPS